jgi:hypothetical protein
LSGAVAVDVVVLLCGHHFGHHHHHYYISKEYFTLVTFKIIKAIPALVWRD